MSGCGAYEWRPPKPKPKRQRLVAAGAPTESADNSRRLFIPEDIDAYFRGVARACGPAESAAGAPAMVAAVAAPRVLRVLAPVPPATVPALPSAAGSQCLGGHSRPAADIPDDVDTFRGCHQPPQPLVGVLSAPSTPKAATACASSPGEPRRARRRTPSPTAPPARRGGGHSGPGRQVPMRASARRAAAEDCSDEERSPSPLVARGRGPWLWLGGSGASKPQPD
mmetsp:Transcript_104826/g.291951  ORF Transcript_104826/g.291951 Transcript_104826/m.291951 type:complete len:224 (-) Transcript_104826:161-832(-)